jgi:hypothetical protein
LRIASEFVVDDTIVFQAIRDIQEQQTTQDERLIKQHLVESGRVLPMMTQDHWSAQMVRRRIGVPRQRPDELNIKPRKLSSTEP